MGMLFTILFFLIFGRMIGFAFRMTWGIFKVLLYIVFLPLILLLMVFGGLIYIALPLLIIVGVLSLITNA